MLAPTGADLGDRQAATDSDRRGGGTTIDTTMATR